MKTLPLFLAAAALLLSSCVSPIQRRVSAFPGMYSELSEKEKEAVQMGQVREGMSRDAVYLAWGNPTRIMTGKREGKSFERWGYVAYQQVVAPGYGYGYGYGYGAGIGVGYWGGRHHRGYGGFYEPFYYGGPAVAYVPTDGRHVEFVGGKVTSYLGPPLPR